MRSRRSSRRRSCVSRGPASQGDPGPAQRAGGRVRPESRSAGPRLFPLDASSPAAKDGPMAESRCHPSGVQEVCELVATGLSGRASESACGIEVVSMTTKKKTGTRGLDRERVRRRKLEQSKAEDPRGQTLEDSAPSNAPDPAAGRALTARAQGQGGVLATGVRRPGQQVTCVWCGESVTVKARGPLPKFCSSNCRHRAWEQERAARAGRAAVLVVDRTVAAYPGDVQGWVDHLERLAHEIRTGQLDVGLLATALENVAAAAAGRPLRPRTGMWTSAALRSW